MTDESFNESFNVILYTYVLPAVRFFVLILKIHCWSLALHRNAESGVVETTSSFTVDEVVPAMTWTSLKDATTPAVPIDTPLASHTRNFAGTVLPCLKTLLPSALMG